MENINSDLIRGNIDTIILKTMLNGDMYGLDIIKEVENKSNGTYNLKQPTLYSCLKRLENQELISSYWLDSDIGGKRHYYKLTEKGHETIKTKQEEWSKSKLIIDNLLGDFNYDEYRLVKKDDYKKIIEGKPVIQYVTVPEGSISQNNNSIINSNTSNLSNFNDNKDSIPASNEVISPIENNYSQDIIVSGDTITNTIEIASNDSLNFTDDGFNDNYDNNNETTETLQKNDEYEEVSTDITNISISENRPNPYDNELISFKPKNENKNNDSYANTKSQEIQPVISNSFDKKESININALEPEKTIQQDLFSEAFMPYQNKVDNVIDEFTTNVTKLNNFDYTGQNKNEVETQNNKNSRDELPSELSILNEAIESNEKIENNEENKDFSEPQENNILVEIEEEIENCYVQENTFDFLSELNELNSSKNVTFTNDDGYHSLTTNNNLTNNQKPIVNENNTNIISPIKNETPSTLDESETFLFDSISLDSTKSQSNYSSQNLNSSNSIVTYKNDEPHQEEYVDFNSEEEKKYESLFAPREELDDIINRSVFAYSQESQKDNYYSSLTSIYEQVNEKENESYKQKVKDLNEYAINNYIVPSEEVTTAKDIQSLKEEYKNEGITVKEFNKTSSFTSSKNYIKVNKLNLIKSLILLFGYVFVLSAMFIIMDSTNLKNMTGFSFTYFLYGFIPFIIYFIYYLVLYLFNPYKKIPAKHSSRVMLIISVIISIQLLLITYCLNLQLGFYSFYQANYNHLFWIIPTIVSFAPIFSTVIYTILFRSKNFNI